LSNYNYFTSYHGVCNEHHVILCTKLAFSAVPQRESNLNAKTIVYPLLNFNFRPCLCWVYKTIKIGLKWLHLDPLLSTNLQFNI